LPWLGGIQNKTVFLDDTAWVSQAISSTVDLVGRMQYSGVHIDFEFLLNSDSFIFRDLEPFENYNSSFEAFDSNLLTFHIKLRSALPKSFISSVVVSPTSYSMPWKKKVNLKTLEELVKYVDQIIYLFYDTSIEVQFDFDMACKEQLMYMKSIAGIAPDVQQIIAIGTFENHPHLRRYRDMSIESIDNTLNTFRRHIINDDLFDLVNGIAVFADWTTDKEEWRSLSKNLD
jgi:hypothetical protein